MTEAENWLYGDGFDSTKQQYAKKIEELRALGDPIEARLTEEQVGAGVKHLVHHALLTHPLTHRLKYTQSIEARLTEEQVGAGSTRAIITSNTLSRIPYETHVYSSFLWPFSSPLIRHITTNTHYYPPPPPSHFHRPEVLL